VSEIHSLLQQVPGVRYIQDVWLEHRRVMPVREQPVTDDESLLRPESDLGPLHPVDRMLSSRTDGLFCSLDHQVHIVDPMAASNPAPSHTSGRNGGANGSSTGNPVARPFSNTSYSG
jgi:hypothetical protein